MIPTKYLFSQLSHPFKSKFPGTCGYSGMKFKRHDFLRKMPEGGYITQKVLDTLGYTSVACFKHYAYDPERVWKDLQEGHEVVMYTKTGKSSTYVKSPQGVHKLFFPQANVSQALFKSRTRYCVLVVLPRVRVAF